MTNRAGVSVADRRRRSMTYSAHLDTLAALGRWHIGTWRSFQPDIDVELGYEWFGSKLADKPAMVNVLADLAIESEAATSTALRLARAYDDEDNALRRFADIVQVWDRLLRVRHVRHASGL